ncbi:hypothetical protein GCK32_014904 [Trichostrongylus colubriformis]|uniref:Uncharacterized protein n=1 Tax=Trichostrongylus colubriformis TaxID=6319 RepID=A0AAN8EVJ1_TRICO
MEWFKVLSVMAFRACCNHRLITTRLRWHFYRPFFIVEAPRSNL